MSFKAFLIILALASVASWIAWIFVIHTIDPTQSGLLGFLLFYATLMIATLGTTVFFGALIRLWTHPDEIVFRQTIRAFRQGVLLTFLFFGALLLLSFELLHWWSGLMLIVLFAFIELLFIRGKSSSSLNTK